MPRGVYKRNKKSSRVSKVNNDIHITTTAVIDRLISELKVIKSNRIGAIK